MKRCAAHENHTFSHAMQGTVHKQFDIINIDRSALGRVAGAIARQHGDKGFAGTIQLTLTGSGGQSFGCFNIQVGTCSRIRLGAAAAVYRQLAKNFRWRCSVGALAGACRALQTPWGRA